MIKSERRSLEKQEATRVKCVVQKVQLNLNDKAKCMDEAEGRAPVNKEPFIEERDVVKD